MKYVLRFVGLSMVVYSEAYYHQGMKKKPINIEYQKNQFENWSGYLGTKFSPYTGSMMSRATNSVMTTTKFLADPEERGKRIVNISKNANIDFLKSFWFLSESELMGQLPSVVADSVEVCKVIQIPPEPLSLQINGKTIQIPIPSSHIGEIFSIF